MFEITTSNIPLIAALITALYFAWKHSNAKEKLDRLREYLMYDEGGFSSYLTPFGARQVLEILFSYQSPREPLIAVVIRIEKGNKKLGPFDEAREVASIFVHSGMELSLFPIRIDVQTFALVFSGARAFMNWHLAFRKSLPEKHVRFYMGLYIVPSPDLTDNVSRSFMEDPDSSWYNPWDIATDIFRLGDLLEEPWTNPIAYDGTPSVLIACDPSTVPQERWDIHLQELPTGIRIAEELLGVTLTNNLSPIEEASSKDIGLFESSLLLRRGILSVSSDCPNTDRGGDFFDGASDPESITLDSATQ